MMSIFKNSILSFFLLSVLFSCKNDDEGNNIQQSPTTQNTPNILLIIADDMGKDATSGFREGSLKPTTPNLDNLKSSGLTFSNFWVNPTCTPTRASIITGKYGFRTGVKQVGDEMASSEITLQQYLKTNLNNAYSTAIVGKWHLSGNGNGVNPENFGIDYYKGLISGAAADYYNYTLSENGIESNETEYITTNFSNLAINWIGQQNKPWFMWLAFNAPHTPFHVPPANTHSQGSLAPYTNGVNSTPYFLAAIESMDYEIGRLLTSLTPAVRANTVVIFIGDNGSPGQVAQAPYGRTKSKGSLYQGGINTPLIVSGKAVSRTGIDSNLITSTDLFATIANIAGVNNTEINDSKNFSSLFKTEGTHRTYQYSEIEDGNVDTYTISNGNFKLIVLDGSEEFYNLKADEYEQNNLLNGTLTSDEQRAKSELEAELFRIRQ